MSSLKSESLRHQSLLALAKEEFRKRMEYQYQAGDFILHTPAFVVHDKLQAIEEVLGSQLPSVNLMPGSSLNWRVALEVRE